ncbi:GGDEF domain-containing phosphodiesterase, partial [Streptomyces lonarensis]|uniref:putative bifunctional diguanylate cyclase/phosphodiesterase n=1 Tax=Streptomyces lonarensis TaxID=700599 RepID=UPI0030C76D72
FLSVSWAGRCVKETPLAPPQPVAAVVPTASGHHCGPLDEPGRPGWDTAPPGDGGAALSRLTATPHPAVPRPGRGPCGRSPRTRHPEEAPPGARAAEALLRQADVALSEAKRSGRPAVEVYDRSRDRHTPGRLALLGDLRAALDNGQVRLHYQPKVRFDGSVAGLEALVRWDHPERGRVAPDEFIAVAESSGLMPRLTDYVLETALAQVARWRTDGIAVPVAVNVSPRDVHTPGFAGAVAARLARHGVPAGALQLEITEHVLLDDPQQAADTLAGLTGHGVRMSLDDFGTGYSSLVHLRRLPVSELKIDRAFVARLAEDGEDAEIVRCTVELAHSLGLAVVAEGVEDGETWNRLRDLGCDAVQGWLLAPAMPASRTTRWLRDHHPPTVADGGPAPAPTPGRGRLRSTQDPAHPTP